jgi:hypothetical protein
MPLLMLCCPLKLGVLNPAGASVADFAATLTSPVPIAIDVARRQEQRRTLLLGGMSMNVPPKDTSVYAGAGHDLTDPFISNLESSDLTFESRGLKSVVLYWWKLECAKIIPTSAKESRALTYKLSDV